MVNWLTTHSNTTYNTINKPDTALPVDLFVEVGTP